MLNILLIIWLAVIGMTRIDIFGREGDFTMTLFLLITPLVLFTGFLRMGLSLRSSKILLPRNTSQYIFLINILLMIILASVLFGLDVTMGLKRFILLTVEIYSTILVTIILYNISDTRKVLVYGAYAGILLSLFFDIGQLLIWVKNPLSGILQSSAIIDFKSPSLGDAIRLSGVTRDANMEGMLLVTYIFLILKLGGQSRWRIIMLPTALLLLVATFSRSAILACTLMGMALLFQERKIKFSIIAKAALTIGVVVLAVILICRTEQVQKYFNLTSLLERRASIAAGTSGGSHFELIKEGLDIANSSIKNLAIGVGFGSSYLVIDRSRGRKYGNFHSMYVSFLVNTGIISLCVFLFLCGLPLMKSAQYGPLMVGLMGFNIFYQSILEPVFWLCLVLLWTNVGFDSCREPSREDKEIAGL